MHVVCLYCHQPLHHQVNSTGDGWLLVGPDGWGTICGLAPTGQSEHRAAEAPDVCGPCGWHAARCFGLPAGSQCCGSCEHYVRRPRPAADAAGVVWP